MKAIKQQIEKELNAVIELIKDTDCANLIYSAFIGSEKVASVYKSFDKNFNQIVKIRYRAIN